MSQGQHASRTRVSGRVEQACTATRQDVEGDGTDCFAVLLVVVTDSIACGRGSSILGSIGNSTGNSSQGDSSLQQFPSLDSLSPREERVRLVLLPASQHPAEYCTQHLAKPVIPGPRLPRAPASLQSLQPPYVVLQPCPAALGIFQRLGCDAVAGKGRGGVFVVDTETTGLSGALPAMPPSFALCPAQRADSVFAASTSEILPQCATDASSGLVPALASHTLQT